MQGRFLLILFLLGFSISSFSQKVYYFKPWKSEETFDNKLIVFQIDTTGTPDEIKTLLIVASKIDDNLKIKGIKTVPIPYPNDTIIDNRTLCLKIENLKMAYVKLNMFENRLPLCFRFRITQTQPKTQRMIFTDVSVSIDKKQQGVDDLEVDLANRLYEHFSLAN